MTLTEKLKGDAPKRYLDLLGLRVQTISRTRFDLHTPSEDRVYRLDVEANTFDNADAVHDLPTWIRALEKEAGLVQRTVPDFSSDKFQMGSRGCIFLVNA